MDEIGGLESAQKIDAKELSLGKTLVENLTTEKFDPGQYSDTYAKELEKLIEAKSKGQKVVAKEEEEEPEETTDILEALKASLQIKTKSPRQRKSKWRPQMDNKTQKEAGTETAHEYITLYLLCTRNVYVMYMV